MRTALREEITDGQLGQLVTRAIQRVQNLHAEMISSGWVANRERYEIRAASDFSDRLNKDPDKQTVFDKSNRSLQTPRAINRFLEARLYKDLFGAKPFYSVKPQGRMDQALADQIQPHSAYKLREADWDAKAKQILRPFLDLGECVFKVTHKTEVDVSTKMAVVLVDVATGEPVLGPDGDVIEEGASGQEIPLGIDDGDPESVLSDDEGNVVMGFQFENGFTLIPGEHEWQERSVPNIQRLYHGPDIAPVYYKDFIWELNVADLKDSSMMAHRFKRRVSQLRAQYDPLGTSVELGEVFSVLEGRRGDNKVEASQQKEETGEPTVCETIEDPEIDVTEIYWDTVLEPDVEGNVIAANAGKPVQVPKSVRLFMVVHETSQQCIWIDYRANICPRAQKPFFMPAFNRVKGRAYGRGTYEMQEMASDAADAMLNGVLFRNEMVTNPPTIFNADLTEEGKISKNLKWRPGLQMTMRGQATDPKNVFQVLDVPDLDDRTWNIMQLWMQLQQAETGVTNAAQAAVSELPGNDLATGINALAEVASILHIYSLEEAKDGFQPGLRYAIELIYFRQDEDETYEYLEGQADQVLALADAKQLAKLAMNVEITLTRAKRQEQREGALAALPVLMQFESLMPDAKIRQKPAYEQALSGMGFDHPESFFPTDEELQAQMVAMQQQAQLEQQAALTGEAKESAATAA